MASDAQIRANQENAKKSTGPTTLEGKAQSRLNATTHGLSGAAVAISSFSPERLALRMAQWTTSNGPQSEHERWLVEKIAIATIRIDLCQVEENALRATTSQRAAILWDEERRVDVEQLGLKLHKNPGLMVAKLKRSVQGCAWLRERWESLKTVAETGDWDASQRSLALDMLAVALELRENCHQLPSEADAAALVNLARLEIDKLDATIEKGLELLDQQERECTVAGLMFVLTADARLIRRYEAEAWKTFWWAERALKACRGSSEPMLRNEPKSAPAQPIPRQMSASTANVPEAPLRNEPKSALAKPILELPSAFTPKVTEAVLRNEPKSALAEPIPRLQMAFPSNVSEAVLRNELKFPISDEKLRQWGMEGLFNCAEVTEPEPTSKPAPTHGKARSVFKNRKARRSAEARERMKRS